MQRITNEQSRSWNTIARIDRQIDLPEDPTLRRAAVWWAVYSELPDEPLSRAWATYVAEHWERSIEILDRLVEGASWIDQPADELSQRVAFAKEDYDSTSSGAGEWFALESERARRLARLVVAWQQQRVREAIARGASDRERVRQRLASPYVAGYVSGLATNWCSLFGLDGNDPRCWSELVSIFRLIFGSGRDEAAAAIFFERWSGEVECVDGMLHAHEDASEFERRAEGLAPEPRMRLFEYLTS